ncbi:MAG: hypothetical protein K2Q06_09265 [Parvularculaceae bacterium]|nr:hypothetical protein [Parvularculaceae bacterium]
MRIARLAAIAFAVAAPSVALADSSWRDPRWEALSPTERIIIDRVAAEFYEEQLRAAQTSAIEATTPQIYRSASASERARFRDERRYDYRTMSPRERDALRGVTRPSFRNLAESQKAPFRAYAIDQLTAAGAVDERALQRAMPNEI